MHGKFSASTLALAAAVSALLYGPAHAQTNIDPAYRLSDLVDRSDVITVGVVGSTTEQGTTQIAQPSGKSEARTVWTARMSVDEVLKGEAPTEMAFQFTVPVPPFNPREISMLIGGTKLVGAHAVVFLRADGGEYRATDDRLVWLNAIAQAPQLGSSPLARVLSAVAAVVDAPGEPYQARRQALDVLRYTDDQAAVGALQPMLSNPDAETRYRAAAYLLEKNDVAALPFTEAAFESGDARDPNLGWLREAIQHSLSTPGAAPLLSSLILPPYVVATRRAAAAALSRTHAPSAVPALALALNDADDEVNYWAVVGLRDAAGQGWGMRRDRFDKHKDELLNQWRDWARARGLIK